MSEDILTPRDHDQDDSLPPTGKKLFTTTTELDVRCTHGVRRMRCDMCTNAMPAYTAKFDAAGDVMTVTSRDVM